MMRVILLFVVVVNVGLGVEHVVGSRDMSERERDFMDWVGRVGERVRNTTSMVNNKSSKNSVRTASVMTSPQSVFIVDKMGTSGNAKASIQDAIDAVPKGNSQRVVIRIAAGFYQEKIRIPSNKNFITLEGEGAGSTVISWYATAGSAGTLQKSATVGIYSDYFIARGITFKNSAPAPPAGAENKQAVAVHITGDKAAFYDCNFIGAQDTLFDDQGRHYFQNCYIQGSVDFICGDGQSLYKGCTLHAISEGSLTAQRRSSSNTETGFSFVGCKVTGSGMVFLGRAWGSHSRVVFSYTYMDNIIEPSGWYNWDDSSRDKTTFYGEYKCSGPGAYQNGRVSWAKRLSDTEAGPFQSLSFIDGEAWVEN